MIRSDFVVGYILKSSLDTDTLQCLACDISEKRTHGYCTDMQCTHDRFDNTKHIPIVTQKECKRIECSCISCDRCVMFLKFGVRKR